LKNKVEVIKETLENYEEAGVLTEKAMTMPGALR
jgi:hypothetical protein